jgi:hypothetical protein
MASFEEFLKEENAIEELKYYLTLVEFVNYPETTNIKRIKEIVSKSDNVQKEQYHNQSA